MIEALMAFAALFGAQTPPADQAYIRCAFQRAGELATATSDPPEAVANRVIEVCAPAAGADGPAMTDAIRSRVRAAAIAVVNRRRGLDGQPPEAPIRLPAPGAPIRLPAPGARLEIPDEIARAVVPYIACLHGSRGTPVYSNGVRQPAFVAEGTDCRPHRERAAREAERMLRDQRRGSGDERRAYVEAVLARVDAFVAGADSPGALDDGARDDAAKPEPADATMAPIDLPYQAIPAFQAYTTCVDDHFRESRVEAGASEDETRRAYADAIAICRTVRNEQLARAEEAVDDARTPLDTRTYRNRREARAAVRRAFDRFDTDFEVEQAAPEPETDAEDR